MLRQKQLEMVSQSAERAHKVQDHSTSQVKVVRVNNFIQGAQSKARVANSHSPSGLAAGNSKDS